jgi:hypothetical protein
MPRTFVLGAVTGTLAGSATAAPCTGSSGKLAQPQCDAWQDFFDSTGGVNWLKCSSSRNDPCSCHGWRGLTPTCSADGMSVVEV